jgi:hypothetical protein
MADISAQVMADHGFGILAAICMAAREHVRAPPYKDTPGTTFSAVKLTGEEHMREPSSEASAFVPRVQDSLPPVPVQVL